MSRHLGDQVSAYVDRRLAGSALVAWDRHVLVCAQCRYAVDQERGLLSSLRSAPVPGVSDNLQALLLGMGNAPANARFIAVVGSMPGPGPRSGPPRVPAAPFAVQGMRLPTMAPGDPPRHRSARRAALVAGLAAGASAAAAWTVGLAPVATSAAPAGAPTPARVGSANGSGAAYSGMLSFPVSQVVVTSHRTASGATQTSTLSTTETPSR